MHCNKYEGDGRVEDVVTTSKRIANGRKKSKAICAGPKIRYGQLFNGEEVERSFEPVDNLWQHLRKPFAAG